MEIIWSKLDNRYHSTRTRFCLWIFQISKSLLPTADCFVFNSALFVPLKYFIPQSLLCQAPMEGIKDSTLALKKRKLTKFNEGFLKEITKFWGIWNYKYRTSISKRSTNWYFLQSWNEKDTRLLVNLVHSTSHRYYFF